MRWLPSKRLRARSHGGPRVSLHRWLPVLLVLAGCAGAVEGPVTGPAPRRDLPYLLSPLAGYPLAAGAENERRLVAAHAALVDRGDAATARETAAALLGRDPGLHPASVLLAQIELIDRDYQSALERLDRVVGELPSYTAALVARGRAAEAVGDVALAFDSFQSAAAGSLVARERAEELRPRAVEIVYNRVEEALRRNRPDEAAGALERLVAWAPEESLTLRAARRVAAARGDLPAELVAVRSLSERFPDDRELRLRRSDLELEVGEPGAGLRILQELAVADPDDPVLAERLERAKFTWRLVLLPEPVRAQARLPELTRGDFASVLYWLFPSVRYGRTGGGRIANDVFDHPSRDAIVRVVNLGLMSVDPALHRFEPESPLLRLTAIDSLLRLLALSEPPLACLRGGGGGGSSVESLCGDAVRCRLIDEIGECLPSASVSGAAAVEMCRRALEQLGV